MFVFNLLFYENLLAYSGGLDTSVLVVAKEHYNADIITFAADVGQEEELDSLAEKAKATGASAHRRSGQEFARDFIYPMMRANAIYEGRYARHINRSSLIAKAHIEIAEREEADAVSHGAMVSNDQVRFELGYAALAPKLKILAMARRAEAFQGVPR